MAALSVLLEKLIPGELLGASIIVLFIGTIINSFFHPAWVKPALKFTSKKGLQAAIVLLGASLSVSTILSVGILRPELKHYLRLVKQIRSKIKQRKLLIDERKNVPAWNLAMRQDLAKQIATLAEDIEELRSEKAMLLRSLDCADDAVMGDVKKDIAAMEAALKKLDEQESKYSAELESVLHQYRELESQAAEFNAEELGDARLTLRPGMDRSTVSRIQTAYDTQYSPFIMAEARRHISQMLDEHDEESCSIRERLRNHQQAQSDSRGKEKDINR